MKKQVNVRIRIPIEKGNNQHMIKRSVFAYFEKEPDVMKVSDIVKVLRCSKNTVYELLKNGRIESIKIGRRILIPKTALVEFIVNEENYTVLSPERPKRLWTFAEMCGNVSVADGHTKRQR